MKDAFHRQVVDGEQTAANPAQRGTKACLHHTRSVQAGASTVVRLRLCAAALAHPLQDVDTVVACRLREAAALYAGVHPARASEDERRIQRQAFAGLMWSKQNYLFDVNLWVHGDDPRAPPPASRHCIRNTHWRHLDSMRVLSMPDKWKYPWFAAWDLAFHTASIALIDAEFANGQLWFMLFEQFQHPSGQIPASAWEFSDLNPPVHPWAVWRVYNMDRIRSGTADRVFLDEEDGFFYDVLRYPDGRFEKLRVRSLVGLIPLYAVERLEERWTGQFKEFSGNLRWFLETAATWSSCVSTAPRTMAWTPSH